MMEKVLENVTNSQIQMKKKKKKKIHTYLHATLGSYRHLVAEKK